MTTDNGIGLVSRPKWLYRGLIASLGLNLLFIGGAGAVAWQHRHGRHHSERGLMGFASQLPDARQKIVRDNITAAREATRPMQGCE